MAMQQMLGPISGSSAYEIERSLRFNSADSAYLNRTPSSAGNRKTWTWSSWAKNTRTAQLNRYLVNIVILRPIQKTVFRYILMQTINCKLHLQLRSFKQIVFLGIQALASEYCNRYYLVTGDKLYAPIYKWC